jgi:hypothetical protein
MVKLNETKSKEKLLMRDLKDGQIAEIIDKGREEYYGRIVQRYNDHAISLGKSHGNGWTGIAGNTLEVRLLEEGETLTIFDNE